MASEAITSRQFFSGVDQQLKEWRSFRLGYDIGHLIASSIEVDIAPGETRMRISDIEQRAAPAEGIADLIVPREPIRKLGFGAIVGLDNQNVHGYLGLGGLNFVSHDFDETVATFKNKYRISPEVTTRFGVDAIPVGSRWKPWHILAEPPVYSSDDAAQKIIDEHYQQAEGLLTEDRLTHITSALAHVRVIDGESLLSTEWITAHDIALANDVINRQSGSAIENRGAGMYKSLVRYFIGRESANNDDIDKVMAGLESEYELQLSMTSTEHLFDHFFDKNRSQIIISRAALTETINDRRVTDINGLGPKGLEVVRLITDESMHLRPRKY